MESIQFDWNNLSLPIPQATLQHVADIDPTLRWEKRGLKSHEKDEEAEKALKKAIREANQFIETSEGQQKLQGYIGESFHVFNDLMRNSEWFEKHFPDHHFYFIVGPMRTGGTYLFTELCNLFDVDWKTLNFRMVHDSIPTPEFLSYPENPRTWLPFAFEMAQYLNWVKQAYPDRRVIKKRITFGHCLGVLDELFGDNADYLLPIRHPAGIAQSGSELLETFHTNAPRPDEKGWNFLVQDRTDITEDEWEVLGTDERILKYWEVYYRDVAESAPLAGTLRPVAFGEDSEDVIRTIAKKENIDYEPGAFTPKNRDFDGFWTSKAVEKTFDRIEQVWKLHDLSFPDVPLR